MAEILLAPLGELLEVEPWSEVRLGRIVWHFPWRGVDIWGVTGNILKAFLEVWREGKSPLTSFSKGASVVQ